MNIGPKTGLIILCKFTDKKTNKSSPKLGQWYSLKNNISPNW
jgi:hypothetical protein